jgi:hypothetical protein
MKAILCESYGPPERALRLADVEKPIPAEGQVLLKVHAASVNIGDYYGMTNLGRLFGEEYGDQRTKGLGVTSQGKWRPSGPTLRAFGQEMRCLECVGAPLLSTRWPEKSDWP